MRTHIKYDVDIDLKIVGIIRLSKNEIATSGDLRINACGTPAKLEEHLSNLKKWGLINDKKPEKYGKARQISLNKPHTEVIHTLLKLKNAIKIVNEYLD